MLAELCTMLDDIGIDAQFFGQVDWHLQYCKGGLIDEISLEESDTLLVHYAKLDARPNVKRVILSCHETGLFDLKTIHTPFWDVAQFVSEQQADFQGRPDPYVVIPNYVAPVACKDRNPTPGVAAIIGNITPAKRTHLSIERALADGFTDIRIYGYITVSSYFKDKVEPLLADSRVSLMGYENNKSEIYRDVSAVYTSFTAEAYDLVRIECAQLGIPYNSTYPTPPELVMIEKEDYLNAWLKLLDL